MSIHKSQGQTLDRVKVDLAKVFEKGEWHSIIHFVSDSTIGYLCKAKPMSHFPVPRLWMVCKSWISAQTRSRLFLIPIVFKLTRLCRSLCTKRFVRGAILLKLLPRKTISVYGTLHPHTVQWSRLNHYDYARRLTKQPYALDSFSALAQCLLMFMSMYYLRSTIRPIRTFTLTYTMDYPSQLAPEDVIQHALDLGSVYHTPQDYLVTMQCFGQQVSSFKRIGPVTGRPIQSSMLGEPSILYYFILQFFSSLLGSQSSLPNPYS